MKTSDILLDTLEMFVNDHPELEDSCPGVSFGEREVVGVSQMIVTEVLVNGQVFEIRIIPK